MPVFPAPPAQTRTCGTTALGSCLGSDAETLIRKQEVPGLGSWGNANEAKVRVGCGDIASLTELGIPESDAHYYSAGIERGGYLLTEVAGKKEQQFVGNEVSLSSSEIFQEHDIRLFEVRQRKLQEGRAEERELPRPEAAAETEAAGPGGVRLIWPQGGTIPRIYDNPNEKLEQLWENNKRPTMGNGPAGPSAQTDNRVNFVLIAIALAFVLAMMFFKVAGG